MSNELRITFDGVDPAVAGQLIRDLEQSLSASAQSAPGLEARVARERPESQNLGDVLIVLLPEIGHEVVAATAAHLLADAIRDCIWPQALALFAASGSIVLHNVRTGRRARIESSAEDLDGKIEQVAAATGDSR